MYTKEEIIERLEELYELMQDQDRCKTVFNLDDDAFYPFMTGYLTSTIKSVALDLRLLKE